MSDNTLNQVDLAALMQRANRVLTQLEAWLPPAPPEVDWSAQAYRWRKRGSRGWLDAVHNISKIRTEDLQHIERQKGVIERNTGYGQKLFGQGHARPVCQPGAKAHRGR